MVTGWGRSGSTILGSMLGQLDGFVSVGELQFIWDRGLLENTPCACQRRFRDCQLWSVAAREYIDAPADEIKRIIGLRESFKTTDYLTGMRSRGAPASNTDLVEYAGHLGRLYRRIREVTGCEVIVDTSKLIPHGVVCRMIPYLDVHVLHLIRDPRAVAFSWKRLKVYANREDGVPKYMRRRNPMDSSFHWIVRNALVEYLWRDRKASARYMRLFYEDFVKAPRETIRKIRDFAGENSPLDRFPDERTVEMERTHEVSGNPSRYQSGRVEIKPDAQWSLQMPWKDRIMASVVALPLLHRYGYSVMGERVR